MPKVSSYLLARARKKEEKVVRRLKRTWEEVARHFIEEICQEDSRATTGSPSTTLSRLQTLGIKRMIPKKSLTDDHSLPTF